MARYDAAAAGEAPAATFTDVLAHLASGVAIVSCWDGEAPRGLLVSSITGLSVEPPRFLFCVRKEAGCHDALLRRPALSVSLLAADDKEEALRFASGSRAAERFAPERWRLQPGAPPAFRGGIARAECFVDAVIDTGSHSVFIVEAERFAFTPAAPLVAWNRGLASLGGVGADSQ